MTTNLRMLVVGVAMLCLGVSARAAQEDPYQRGLQAQLTKEYGLPDGTPVLGGTEQQVLGRFHMLGPATDAAGTGKVRGVLGEYRITVTAGVASKTTSATLTREGTRLRIVVE